MLLVLRTISVSLSTSKDRLIEVPLVSNNLIHTLRRSNAWPFCRRVPRSEIGLGEATVLLVVVEKRRPGLGRYSKPHLRYYIGKVKYNDGLPSTFSDDEISACECDCASKYLRRGVEYFCACLAVPTSKLPIRGAVVVREFHADSDPNPEPFLNGASNVLSRFTFCLCILSASCIPRICHSETYIRATMSLDLKSNCRMDNRHKAMPISSGVG